MKSNAARYGVTAAFGSIAVSACVAAGMAVWLIIPASFAVGFACWMVVPVTENVEQ